MEGEPSNRDAWLSEVTFVPNLKGSNCKAFDASDGLLELYSLIRIR